MIKSNLWKLMVLVLVVLVYLGYTHFAARERYLNINTHSSKENPLNQEIHFHTDQVVYIFKRNHIKMTQEKNETSQYDIAGVHPTIYELNKNKDFRLLVYIFDSLKKRKQVSQKIADSFNQPFSKGSSYNKSPAYVYGHYSSWNVLFLIPFSTTTTDTEYKKFPNIGPIIFKDMDDGKTRIYKGKTQNWNATFTYTYFDHWYKDKSGVVVTDDEGKGTFDITYNGDESLIKNLTLSYEMPGSGSSLSGSNVKTTRPFHLNYTANQTILYPSDQPKMTFQWDGKKESVVLKPQ